jgi:hypothetical protein
MEHVQESQVSLTEISTKTIENFIENYYTVKFEYCLIIFSKTVVACSKTLNAFAHRNTGILISKVNRSMDVHMSAFLFVCAGFHREPPCEKA